MAKIVCLYCSHVVEDPPASPSQCPACGRTFPLANDSTHSQFRGPSTLIAPPVECPQQIGRYLIEGELGQGGFGTVFLAKDPQLDRLVAIKIPRADTGHNPAALERFAREGRSAAQLRHPGIVSVYNVEQVGTTPFIVSEYVEGMSLGERLRKDPLFSFRQSAEFLAAVAAAVAYAHSRGVIHRDIKPANILIASDGTPRLLDFGLARRESIDESITMAHHIIGTPGYMSPEQAWGKPDKVDRRTDIYSLGVVLYQLLTGEMPFRGEPRMILRQVIEEDPRNPRSLNADIPLDLETICEKAMEKEADSRYQTADKLAEELGKWLRNEPIEARPITRLQRTWRWCRRNPLTSGLVASIAVLLTAIALGATALYASEHRRRTQVEDLLDEKSELLSKSYVERANRYLGPQTVISEFSPLKALPWLYAALEVDEHNPKRWEASRLRLGAALRNSPSVEKIWSHKGGITTAAISPSGDRFLTGGNDGTAYVWDLAKDESVAPAMAHPGAVTDATFSPDGKLIATGSADGAIRLWDAATSKLVVGPFWDAEFTRSKASTEILHYVSVSARGLLLLTRCDKNAQVWDIKTGRPIGKAIVTASDNSTAQFADSGKLIVTAMQNGSIIVWDAQTGKEKLRLQDKSKAVAFASVAPDGITVAGTDSESVRLWNCRSGEKLALPPLVHGSRVSALQFSSDNALLATATAEGVVQLWKLSDGSLVWQRRVSAARVSHLSFAVNGRQLAATNSLEGVVSIVDVERGDLGTERIEVPSDVRFAQWTHEKGMFLTASANGAVRLWRTDTQESGFVLPHSARLVGAAVSDNRQTLATIDRDGTCCVADPGDETMRGPNVQSIRTGIDKPAAVALSPDGTKLAFADSQWAVSLWDVSGAKKVHELDPGVPVARRAVFSETRLAFSSDGRLLIHVVKRLQERFCRVAVWDVNTRERLQHERLDLDGDFNDVDLQAKGSLCAIKGGKQVIAWDAATGRRVDPILTHDRTVTSCRVSSDGTHMLTGCNDGVARVWSLKTGKIVAASQKQAVPIRCVSFSGDGERFATGCDDGSCRIWSTTTSIALTAPLSHGASVTGCSFSPNSRWLLTTSGDGPWVAPSEPTIRGWDVSTGEPLFVLPLSVLQRQERNASGSDPSEPLQLQFSFFSMDSRRLHLVLRDGRVATLSLDPDARTSADLLREIVLRSGTQPDGAGGLSTVEPDRLVRVFRREQ